MKTLLLSTCTALVVVCSGAAMAADLPVRAAPVVAPVAAPWTGCGLGFHAGGAWGDKWWADPAQGSSSVSYSLSGQLAGAQLYCDYQTGPFVVGLEGSYSWTNLSGNGSVVDDVFFGGAVRRQSKIDSVTSGGGRVGLVAGSALIYARVAALWAHQEQTLFWPAINTQTQSDTRVGYGIGAGVEYMIAPVLTVRLEYNYNDFGAKNYNYVRGLGLVPFTASDETRFHVMKIGVNYKFW